MKPSNLLLRMTLLVVGFLLSGCDLTEAERVDFGRHGVDGVHPSVGKITFQGRTHLSIDSLLGVSTIANPMAVWNVELSDSGSPAVDQWVVRGWVGDSLVFQTRSDLYYGWDVAPRVATILGRPDSLRTEFVLIANHWVESSDSWSGRIQVADTVARIPEALPVRVDINQVLWDTGFAHLRVHTGDTLRLPVRVVRGAPGSAKALSIYADYHGLRTLGDYVFQMGPDTSDTLAWEVTAPAGDTLSVDLGCGGRGLLAHFGFRVSH